MDFDEAREFASGAMGPAAQARWEAHLRTCPHCRQLLADERAWAGVFKVAEEPPLLDGAVDRALARLAPLQQPRARRSHWLAFAASVGLAALLGVVLGAGYRLTAAPAAPRAAPQRDDLDALERAVVANLNALQTIGQDSWVVDNYAEVRWLFKLIVDEGGG